MKKENTLNYITSIINNHYLATSIYDSVDSAIKNPLVKLLNKTTVKDIFTNTLNNSIRDIENHPHGFLFKRLIEYGPLNPDEDELSVYPKNTILSDGECISAVNFIYSHIINSFKGGLAELLAIKPCLKLFNELQLQNKISSNAIICFGDYIMEYQETGRLAKGADGLIAEINLNNDSLSAKGVIEIKSMPVSTNRINSQISKHIDRLRKGLKLGDQIYSSKNVFFNPNNVLRILVVPSSWKVNRKFEWIEKDEKRCIKFPDPDKAENKTSVKEIGHNKYKVTLSWSKEAIEQAAYEMTFNYMSEVGKAVYNSKPLPKGWEGMSPEEAGYNSIKEKLYYIMLHQLNKYQGLRATKLYNVYSFGYPLGIDSKEMLWAEGINKLEN